MTLAFESFERPSVPLINSRYGATMWSWKSGIMGNEAPDNP